MPGLLCIIAHPDDELFCAGLIARLTSTNIPVHIVCMTRGEGGQLGDPPLATRENIGKVREREMCCSAKVLQVTSLTFWDYIDPHPEECLKAPDYDPVQLDHDIADAFDRYQPEVVLTHGSNGEYGHPAHIVVHERVKAVIRSLGYLAPILYSFKAAHVPLGRDSVFNKNDWADWVLSNTVYNKQVVAAMECHFTQWQTLVGHNHSKADYERAIINYVRTTSLESYHRHIPRDVKMAPDVLAHWLNLSIPKTPLRRYISNVKTRILKHSFPLHLILRRILRKGLPF